MVRLDKYFIKDLARSTFFSSLVAILVLVSLQAIRLTNLIVNQELDIPFVVRMAGGLGLSFVGLVLPIAFLFALLNVFGRMASDREFIGMQALGHSPRRLLHPCLKFGVLITLLSLLSSFYLSPLGNRVFEASINEAYKKKVTTALRAGTFSEGFLGMVFFVDSIDIVTDSLKRVFIFDDETYKNEATISAPAGVWRVDEKSGLGTLNLENGVIISEDRKNEKIRRITFDRYRVNADFSREAGTSKNSPQSLDAIKLFERRKELMLRKENGESVYLRPTWVEIARRFAIGFACLLFVPLCFFLSFDNSRTARSNAILKGLSILILYWTLYFSLVTWHLKTRWSIAVESELFSWFVMWLPNLMIFLAALYFERRTRLLKKH